MLSTITTKIIVLFALLIGTFFFSMLPVKLISAARRSGGRAQRRKYKAGLSLMSCFAAGVFLATCLLHLFPEAQSQLEDAFANISLDVSFPMGEFLLAFGMFLMLIIEQLVLSCKDVGSSHERKPLLDHDSYNSTDGYYSSIGSETSSIASHPGISSLREEESSGLLTEHLPDINSGPEDIQEHIEEEQVKNEPYKDPSSHSVIRSVMLLLALSIHSVFEGMAVGLQVDTRGVLQIFAALALHKVILAFSLGMNLVQSKLELRAIVKSNILFALSSPVGVGIGIGVTKFITGSFEASIINGTLQGIACGTFLYVVFFEILPHEFNSVRKYPNRMLKVLFLILGYCVVTLLLFLAPDEDSRVKPNCNSGG